VNDIWSSVQHTLHCYWLQRRTSDKTVQSQCHTFTVRKEYTRTTRTACVSGKKKTSVGGSNLQGPTLLNGGCLKCNSWYAVCCLVNQLISGQTIFCGGHFKHISLHMGLEASNFGRTINARNSGGCGFTTLCTPRKCCFLFAWSTAALSTLHEMSTASQRSKSEFHLCPFLRD